MGAIPSAGGAREAGRKIKNYPRRAVGAFVRIIIIYRNRSVRRRKKSERKKKRVSSVVRVIL